MSDENNMYEKEQQDNQGTIYNDQSYQNNNGGPVKGQGTGLGIASMVLGIVSIPMMCCGGVSFLCIVLGIVSIVLGIVQIVKNEKKGMAIAGIVCSAVAIVLYICLFAFGAILLSSGAYEEIMNSLN